MLLLYVAFSRRIKKQIFKKQKRKEEDEIMRQ